MDDVILNMPKSLYYLLPWLRNYARQHQPPGVRDWRFVQQPLHNFFHEGIQRQSGAFWGKVVASGANLPCIELKIKQQDRACEVALRCNEPALSNYFLQLVQELECWWSQEKGTDVHKHKPAAIGGPLAPETARLSGETPVVALGERSVAIGGNVSNSLIIVGNANSVGDGSNSRISQETPASSGEAAARPTGSAWDTTTIRELLNTAFGDEELMILCSDHFRPVYEDFADGMSKRKKIQRLLDYCLWQEQMDDLLAAVKKANPRKYQQFEGRLTESGDG